ncbi:MAG: TetR/AcrR family transcriptional regulator [Actinomycetota bacterium]
MTSRERLTASERRAQLVEVGRDVFAERGYEAASVEEIAERAKVSKPIVYEHFGGKEGLYAVIIDREMEHVVSQMTDAISSGSPRERLEQAAIAFLTYVKEEPQGFAVLRRDAPVTTATGGISGLLSEVAERVSKVFTNEFRKAGYDAKAAPIYAHALVGMVTFVGQWWTDAQQPSIDRVAAHITALAWMGLRHLPKKPALTTAKKPRRSSSKDQAARA